MFIEKWKDTAFGTDFGSDFQDFLEKVPQNILTLAHLYANCDLEKYVHDAELLKHRKDNTIFLRNTAFEQYVHYEDAVIALVAIVVEAELNGFADLTKAYGTKILKVSVTKEELIALQKALNFIHDNPDKFILFELSMGYSDELLSDIGDMLEQLQICIDKK